MKAWKYGSAGQADQLAGMAPELKEAVEEFLQKNKVVLFMKGTKQFPQCGFSNTCVQVQPCLRMTNCYPVASCCFLSAFESRQLKGQDKRQANCKFVLKMNNQQ